MRARLLPLCLLLPLAGGCLSGRIYQHYTVPLVKNMHTTPRGSRMVNIGSHYVEAPFTQGMVNAEWLSRAIGDAAKRQGLDTVYFADMHTLSILWLYKRQRVEVWGD